MKAGNRSWYQDLLMCHAYDCLQPGRTLRAEKILVQLFGWQTEAGGKECFGCISTVTTACQRCTCVMTASTRWCGGRLTETAPKLGFLHSVRLRGCQVAPTSNKRPSHYHTTSWHPSCLHTVDQCTLLKACMFMYLHAHLLHCTSSESLFLFLRMLSRRRITAVLQEAVLRGGAAVQQAVLEGLGWTLTDSILNEQDSCFVRSKARKALTATVRADFTPSP
jgi:hypothetical protein